MRTVKWAKDFKLDMSGAFGRAAAKLKIFIDGANKLGWARHYGRDGERIYTLKYHYQVRGGKSPLEAVASIEKGYKSINPKAWGAAALDALAEESKLPYFKRADGVRVVRLDHPPGKSMFWSGLGKGGGTKARAIADAKGLKPIQAVIEGKGLGVYTENAETIGYVRGNPYRLEVWDGLSEQYAKEASGKVFAVLGDELTADTIWSRVEYPTLLKNPNVLEIWKVNPDTLLETLLWRR